jgi:glycosyltransferase involved in cell wall biosynthesis
LQAIIPERYGRGIVRALVVSNMQPDAAHPERGQFVRDQVAALEGLRAEGLEVELYEFPPGAGALARAALDLRRRHAPRRLRGRRGSPAGFDVVHAHFGLTAWPALAVPARVRALTVHGTDVSHPRTRLATRAVMPLIDLPAAVSRELAGRVPGAAHRAVAVLPCGVDLGRFHPASRAEARAALGLDAAVRYLLFPADPARPEKRYDRALELARAVGAELLTLGGIAPALVPRWVCAADAVVVPSEREGFGLAVLEALACAVPVLATPVGIHAEALRGVAGSLCAPFDLARWSAAVEPHLIGATAPGGHVSARESAARFSASAMAELVLEAWRTAVYSGG